MAGHVHRTRTVDAADEEWHVQQRHSGHSGDGVILRGVERLIGPFDAASSSAARALIASLPWAHDRACRASLLTANGAPVEVTYAGDSAELRLTVEGSYPDDSPARKWRAISAVAGELDHPLLAELRRAPGQRFGCWLSARWRGPRPLFKVYQEVTRRFEGAPRGIVPSLAGFDGTLEVYGRVIDPSPHTLHEILAAAGLAAQLPPFLDVFGFFASRERARLFDSVHLAAGIRSGIVTFYAPARQLFANESATRSRVLALAHELGQSLTHYETATRQNGGVHGLAGIAIDGGPLRCSIGVAP